MKYLISMLLAAGLLAGGCVKIPSEFNVNFNSGDSDRSTRSNNDGDCDDSSTRSSIPSQLPSSDDEGTEI